MGPSDDREPAEPVLHGELRDELVRAMQRVPELAGRELTLTALSGGITNRNFLVTRRGGSTDRYVIRLAGNDTHLLGISREVEHAATVAAAGVGVGPEVTAFIRPEGYLVTRFIEGSPVSRRGRPPARDDRAGSPTRSAGSTTARRSRGCSSRSGSSRRTGRWPWRAACRSRPSTSWPPRSAGGSSSPAWRTRSSSGRATTTCCNANFIDDGERIRIVDWEYAGMGDPFFDLGNFSINHELTADEDACCWRRTTAGSRVAAPPGSPG